VKETQQNNRQITGSTGTGTFRAILSQFGRITNPASESVATSQLETELGSPQDRRFLDQDWPVQGLTERPANVYKPSPLPAGSLIVYRDATGRLRGGLDEPDLATVRTARYSMGSWTFQTNGTTLVPGRAIVSVAVMSRGRVIAAWSTRSHGLDGLGGTIEDK